MRECKHRVEGVGTEAYCQDCGETDLKNWDAVTITRAEFHTACRNAIGTWEFVKPDELEQELFGKVQG